MFYCLKCQLGPAQAEYRTTIYVQSFKNTDEIYTKATYIRIYWAFFCRFSFGLWLRGRILFITFTPGLDPGLGPASALAQARISKNTKQKKDLPFRVASFNSPRYSDASVSSTEQRRLFCL